MSNSNTPSNVTDAMESVIHNPEAPPASTQQGAQRADEEDEGDLNKALGVQRFQQIISPAPRIPDEQHRTYSEEDFEYHRHSSHHMHHPLSKLHFEGRRKKSGKKKKESDRKDNSGPTSSTTIEEGEDEEDNEEEGGESHTHLSETYCDTVKEDVQVPVMCQGSGSSLGRTLWRHHKTHVPKAQKLQLILQC